MFNQQNLRKRLHSVRNVKNITEAIELVAGVKFRKLMNKREHFRFYADKLSDIMQNLALSREGRLHPLFEVRERQRIAVIVVASDKGLCGSYNANLFKCAEKFLDGYAVDEVELFLFGQKALDYFKKTKWTIKKSVTDYVRQLSEKTVKDWSAEYISAFEEREFDELWIASTHFKNILSKEPCVEKILPLKKEEAADGAFINYIFEPDPQTIYLTLIPYFFYTKIQAFLFESYAAELASRIISMKAATKNADEMIKKLTLIKNKVRQFGITKEILEINAGAEGIK